MAFDIDHFIERLDVLQRAKAGVVIAVSEGVRVHDGRYVCELTEELGPRQSAASTCPVSI